MVSSCHFTWEFNGLLRKTASQTGSVCEQCRAEEEMLTAVRCSFRRLELTLASTHKHDTLISATNTRHLPSLLWSFFHGLCWHFLDAPVNWVWSRSKTLSRLKLVNLSNAGIIFMQQKSKNAAHFHILGPQSCLIQPKGSWKPGPVHCKRRKGERPVAPDARRAFLECLESQTEWILRAVYFVREVLFLCITAFWTRRKSTSERLWSWEANECNYCSASLQLRNEINLVTPLRLFRGGGRGRAAGADSTWPNGRLIECSLH